jgi:hypothetical protein
MDDLDTIPVPTNSGAKAEFEHLRSLVAIHITAATAHPQQHARLAAEIVDQIEDAEAAETAIREFQVPTAVDDLALHNRALRKAVESRAAYGLLQRVLQKHCRGMCTPIN